MLIFLVNISTGYLLSQDISSLSNDEENMYQIILKNWRSYSKDNNTHPWKDGISWKDADILYKKRAYLENEFKYIVAKSFMEYINFSWLLFFYPALLGGNYDVLRLYAGIYGLAFLSDIGIKIKKDSDYKKKLKDELIIIDQILSTILQLESQLPD